jgi:hypothetical protein
MDGTFKSCPDLFRQMYVIHCEVGDHFFPFFYCFATDSIQDTYVRILTSIRLRLASHGVVFQPIYCSTDFEEAAISAFRQVFPGSHVSGCNFHFAQAIRRKIQTLGLQRMYDTDKHFKSLFSRILILQFILMQYFYLMSQHILDNFGYQTFPDFEANYRHNPKVAEFMQYLHHTWILTTSLFPPPLWNNVDVREARRQNSNVCENSFELQSTIFHQATVLRSSV